MILGRGPGEYEHVMSLAGLDLGECAVANSLDGNNVDCHFRVIFPAPIRGYNVHKPLIEFREKVGPFGDLQRLLAGESAPGKKEEWPESGGTGRQSKEITARSGAGCSPGHLGTLFGHDIIIQHIKKMHPRLDQPGVKSPRLP